MVGGLWRIDNDNGGVAAYRTLHLNSSRPRTQFPSYPMPQEWPDYPSHEMVAAYFQRFAEDHDLLPRITFRTPVTAVRPLPASGLPGSNGWSVTTPSGTRCYRHVLLANGHHSTPQVPTLPGSSPARCSTPTTTGTRPSSPTRTSWWWASATPGWTWPATPRGPRARSSWSPGTACTSSRSTPSAGRSTSSARKLTAYVPFPVERKIYETVLRLSVGRPQDRGLPEPDHRLLHAHPTVSAELYDRVGHGDITMKPGIERLDGERVRFADGTVERTDLLVLATGYRVVAAVPRRRGVRPLAATGCRSTSGSWPPERPGLFFLGFIQTVGSGIPLYEYQAEWVGDVITGACGAALGRPDAGVDRARPSGAREALRPLRAAHDAGRLLELHPGDEGGTRDEARADAQGPRRACRRRAALRSAYQRCLGERREGAVRRRCSTSPDPLRPEAVEPRLEQRLEVPAPLVADHRAARVQSAGTGEQCGGVELLAGNRPCVRQADGLTTWVVQDGTSDRTAVLRAAEEQEPRGGPAAKAAGRRGCRARGSTPRAPLPCRSPPSPRAVLPGRARAEDGAPRSPRTAG